MREYGEKLILGAVGRLGRHARSIGASAFSDCLVQEHGSRNGQDERQAEPTPGCEDRVPAGTLLALGALGQESPLLSAHRVDDGPDLIHEALAFIGDVRVIRFGAPSGAARLRRHLWRMSFGLFVAAGSFFSIRARVAKILPEPFLSAPIRLLPILLIFLAMFYWLWRVRIGRSATSSAS